MQLRERGCSRGRDSCQEDPEEEQSELLLKRQICSLSGQRKERLEKIIRREKRELRNSGNMERKLTSEGSVYLCEKEFNKGI